METGVIFKDYSIEATRDEQGVLKVLEGTEALQNALRQWIMSFRGEFNRNPSKGGYVTQWLTKPMTPENVEHIKQAIYGGLIEDFYPAITLTALDVIPHYEKSYLEIYIEGHSSAIKKTVNVLENVRIIT